MKNAVGLKVLVFAPDVEPFLECLGPRKLHEESAVKSIRTQKTEPIPGGKTGCFPPRPCFSWSSHHLSLFLNFIQLWSKDETDSSNFPSLFNWTVPTVSGDEYSKIPVLGHYPVLGSMKSIQKCQNPKYPADDFGVLLCLFLSFFF